MKLKYSRHAAEDLERIEEYIANELKSPQAAKNTILMLLRECGRLKDFPLLGLALQERIGRDTDYRFLIVRQYVAFYNIVDDTVWVRRIFNARRDYIKHLFI